MQNIDEYNKQKSKSRTWKVVLIAVAIFILELILAVILLCTVAKYFDVYINKVLGPSIPWTLGVMATYIGGEKAKDAFFAKSGTTVLKDKTSEQAKQTGKTETTEKR